MFYFPPFGANFFQNIKTAFFCHDPLTFATREFVFASLTIKHDGP